MIPYLLWTGVNTVVLRLVHNSFSLQYLYMAPNLAFDVGVGYGMRFNIHKEFIIE